MSEVDPQALIEPAATRVRDPVTGRSVWLAKLVQGAEVHGDVLRVSLRFKPQHGARDRQGIEAALTENLRGLGWQGDVAFDVSVEDPPAVPKKDPVPGMSGGGVQPHGGPVQQQQLPGVKHVLLVSSAKGGVGKSTVAVNLAVALARQGHSVGLLDADVYGPSLPRMMNVTTRPLADDDKRVVPVSSYGVKCLSVGLLVPEHEAIIWRGPMVTNLIRQFLQQARWGELDYLVIDMPPGTGDAHLTPVQATRLAGAIIVTTPQEVALGDAVRGITMFRKLDVPLLGLVENMAWYELPDGTRDYVFGNGGGLRLAEREDTEVLGRIPLQTSLRLSGDQGLPAALGNDAMADAFTRLAIRVSEKLPV